MNLIEDRADETHVYPGVRHHFRENYGIVIPTNHVEAQSGIQEGATMGLMDLFRSKWKHPDPEVRKAAVESVTRPLVLFGLAQRAAFMDVRRAAVERLEDQVLLCRLALNAASMDVRLAAVERLEDQVLLARLCDSLNSVLDVSVVAVARRRLTQMIGRIDDQTVVAALAGNDESEAVRSAAVSNLKVQTVLAEVAKNDENRYVRAAAVRRLGDQWMVADIAKTDKHWIVRAAAMQCLEDQIVLRAIAKSDDSKVMRRVAVGRLEDQALLAEFAQTDEDEHVRKAAVSNLEDQAVLTEIARSDEDGRIRMVAVGRLEDRAVLAEIAQSDEDGRVRMVAVGRLGTVGLFFGLLAEGRLDVRAVPAEDAKIRAVLAEVAKNDEDNRVRAVAKEKLEECTARGWNSNLEFRNDEMIPPPRSRSFVEERMERNRQDGRLCDEKSVREAIQQDRNGARTAKKWQPILNIGRRGYRQLDFWVTLPWGEKKTWAGEVCESCGDEIWVGDKYYRLGEEIPTRQTCCVPCAETLKDAGAKLKGPWSANALLSNKTTP
ncbi:MAG: hypothetical protein GY906_09150 [bacterium]|nr:hypothetical protein [bacterium]